MFYGMQRTIEVSPSISYKEIKNKEHFFIKNMEHRVFNGKIVPTSEHIYL